MPRPHRADFSGEIYHALNRGNARNPIFFKDADYEAFALLVPGTFFRFNGLRVNHFHVSSWIRSGAVSSAIRTASMAVCGRRRILA